MARWVYILFTLTTLCAWVGAQGPAPATPSAADQLRLLKSNSVLIENLVDHGVSLSNANTPVQRAEHCRAAAKTLANAIQDAATKQEAERIAELTGLFREVVRDALVPTLRDAQTNIAPESPDAKRLRELRELANADLAVLKAAIPTTGKVAENARVKSALKQLEELTESLK
jgi:DNA primase